MQPRERRETNEQNLFRSRLDQIIDLNHALVKLSRAIDSRSSNIFTISDLSQSMPVTFAAIAGMTFNVRYVALPISVIAQHLKIGEKMIVRQVHIPECYSACNYDLQIGLLSD